MNLSKQKSQFLFLTPVILMVAALTGAVMFTGFVKGNPALFVTGEFVFL